MNEIITKLLASTAALALAAFSPSAFAQSPQGATIASGAITVTRQGSTTVVTQGTDKGIIDWRSFSIGVQEAVRFDQPGRSSVTLNRVTGSELSRIDGSLSATGQVWLSNPNGVLIGPGGQVNVGGLLATTGRIDAGEFLRSGRAAIDQIGKDAAIVNSGTINITEGGYAALAAASIRNDGVIAARAGSVALGSGKAVTLDFTGDKLITFQVTEAADQAPAGDTMISNGGTVSAGGGTVLMSARAAKGVMDNVINLKGHVVANTVKVDGGTVSFGDGGMVQVSGKIDASNAAGKGGAVSVLGEKVGLMDGAAIDASGATGGGTVLVGGDWQGKGSVQNALATYVAPTAAINVDATMAGDGGKAVVWADDATRFNGTISARGGLLAGNGGQVETSGKSTLNVEATARVSTAARAAGAKPGSWLLDPTDVTITTSGAAVTTGVNSITTSTVDVNTIYTALDTGNVTIQTGAGGGNGDITVATPISYSGTGSNTLTLDAVRDITVSYLINSTLSATNVKLLAGRDIYLNAAITTNGGSLTAISNSTGSAAGGIKLGYAISTSGGNVVLAGGTDLTGLTPAVGGSGGLLYGVQMAGGSIDAAGGDIIINGKGFTNQTGVDILNPSSLTTSGAGNIKITGSTPTGSGGAVGVSIASGASISTSGSGTITITGDSSNTGSSSHGVSIAGSVTQSATGGAISITGTRGAGASSSNIALAASAVLSTTTGSLSLIGNNTSGSLTTNNNFGVDLRGTLSTGNGAIMVDGAGPGPASVTGSFNYGVALYSTTSVSASGSGTVLLKGVGSGVSTYYGVFDVSALNSGAIATASGDLIIQSNLTQLSNTTSATDAVKSSTGTVKLKSIALTDSIGLGANTGAAYFGAFVTDRISGKIELGDPSQSGPIQVATGWALKNDTTFVTGGGDITFAGTLNGAFNVTAKTGPSGTVSFTSLVGSLTPLASFTRADSSAGNTAKTVFAAGSNQFTTSGSQSYSGPVALTDPTVTIATLGGAIMFNGPVDSASAISANHSSLLVSTSGGVTFGDNFGVLSGHALASVNTALFTPTTFKGSNYNTDGSQSYGGAVLLANDTTISAGGAVTTNAAVNTAASAGQKALTINAASVSFGSAIGLLTSLSALTVSVTNSAIALPDIVANNLTLSSGSGSITQNSLTALSVSNQTTINTSTGSVTLTNSSNDFNQFAVTIGSTGKASIADSLGNLTITGASLGTGGTLSIQGAGSGTISQSGSITTPSLIFSNADVVKFDDANNQISKLSGGFFSGAASQSLVLNNNAAAGLNLSSLSGKSLSVTQSGAGAVTVSSAISATNTFSLLQSGSGALNVNGTIVTSGKADIYASGAALNFGSGSQLRAATASFGGASVNGTSTIISITNAPLVLYGSSGSITSSTIKVNGSTTPVAAGFVTLSTTGGAILLNSETLNGPPAPVVPAAPTTATTATVASVASVATVATVASVATIAPTVASVATVVSVATVATVPTVASVASVPKTSFVQTVIDFITSAEPAGVTSIIGQILPPTPNFSLVLATPLTIVDSSQKSAAANSSAQALANLVTATPAGAFIPPGAPFVVGTGAPLAVTPTIKVDAADTGGPNGQVIAIGPAGIGPGGGPGGGSGDRTVLPGLLSQTRNPAAAAANREPPAGQLPATMNEEPLLD